MTDSIRNVNDFLSDHWLGEVFPGKVKDLAAGWREAAQQDKPTPMRGLTGLATPYLTSLAELPGNDDVEGVTALHTQLLVALGFTPETQELETTQGDTPVTVPLLARARGSATDAVHVLQARPVDALDDLFADDARLVVPVRVRETAGKVVEICSPAKAIRQLFLTADAPRYLLVLAGSWVLLSDVPRWAEGRYLAFDLRTALSRRDVKATGELARHAGLYSADVLLPSDNGATALETFTNPGCTVAPS